MNESREHTDEFSGVKMMQAKRELVPWRSRRAAYLGLLSCLVWLTGCVVGPQFKAPEVKMPAQWTGPVPTAAKSPTPAEERLAQWWTVFHDPTLTSLMKRAIDSNLDLKLAEARIRQARAAVGVARSGLGPTVDASASLHRSQSPGRTGPGPTTNLYQTGFDAGWELDLFGGVRRGVEAANADLESSVENLRDTMVTLTAEVASDYIDLRTYQERIRIARRNLRAQQQSAALTRKRLQGGLVSALDVANADAQVATTTAQIPELEAAARQSVYALSVLLGRNPGDLVEELSKVSNIPAAPPDAPVGVPSDLLRRRPDIRAAEAEIHAATARIGVAVADLYPKFTIDGTLGFQASDFSSLGEPLSRFWSLGPSVSWNLFQSGQIRANIELQKALRDQSFIQYRQVVLGALQEVENALVASAKEQEHRQALADAVAANRKAVDLATKLYSAGQTEFLNVLDAQRSLYASEDALAQSSGAQATDLTALYKALGGGW